MNIPQSLWTRQLIKTFFIIYLGAAMTSCADTFSWQEEVQLVDGRIITVTQKRRYEGSYNGSNYGGVPRESWLEVKLPETQDRLVIWHEKLTPRNLNVIDGKLYIVGRPPTTREFYLYQKPRPPYIGYVFENNAWQHIPFEMIPEQMYDTNLSLDSLDFIKGGWIKLADKVKELKDSSIPKTSKRITPSYRDMADHN